MIDLETTAIMITIILGSIGIAVYVWNGFGWVFSFKKKPEPDSQPTFTPEQLKIITEQAIETATAKIKEATDAEKAELLDIIDKHKNRLANLPQAFEYAQAQIAELKVTLENEGHDIGEKRLADAIIALENGDFSKADELFAEIEIREKLAVERTARAATARGEIAEQEIRWKDAAEHYARASQLVPNFDTLLRAQSLALAIGDYDSALPLGKAAKKIAIADYGKDSAEYADSLNDLGGAYQGKGLDTEAEPLYNEALIIRKKNLMINHPATSCILNNLAEIYRKRKNFTKAEIFFKQALEIDIKVLGEEHPETATDMNNLAGLYSDQKRYAEAEPLYLQALAIRKKMLEKNHPDIAKTYNNLAILYEKQGRFEKAEPFYLQAIQIFETVFGHEHSDTKIIKRNYEIFKKDRANAEKPPPNKNHT